MADTCENICNSRNKKVLLSCYTCSHSSYSKRKLKKHIHQAHLQINKCKHCSFFTSKKGDLIKHLASVHHIVVSKCLFCEFFDEDVNSLIIHMLTVHPKHEFHKCCHCNYMRYNWRDVKNHLNDEHNGIHSSYLCQYCSFSAIWSSKLFEHIRKEHICVNGCKCSNYNCSVPKKNSLFEHVSSESLEPLPLFDVDVQFSSNEKTNEEKVRSSVKLILPEILSSEINSSEQKTKFHHCGMCNYSARKKSIVQKHMLGKHLGIFEYKCNECDYYASKPGLLQRHTLSKHEGILPYKCQYCNYCATQINHLNRHMLAKHLNIRKFKCQRCTFTAVQKYQLEKHMVTVHKTNYKCTVCNFSTWKSLFLYWHKKARHPSSIKPLYLCSLCEFVHEKHLSFIRHSLDKHDGYMKCHECHFIGNHDTVNYHIKESHQPDVLNKCKICPYIAAREDILEKHLSVMHTVPKLPLRCTECDYAVWSHSELKEHTKANHGKNIDVLECPECDFDCTLKHTLYLHVHSFHSNLRLHCRLCDYSANDEFDIVSHAKNTHKSQEINFTCAFCKFETKNFTDMESHNNSEHLELNNSPILLSALTSGSKYKCFICGLSLLTDELLKSHKASEHSSGMARLCTICFTESSDIWEHLSASHEPPFICPTCQAPFKLYNHLCEHVKTKHFSLPNFLNQMSTEENQTQKIIPETHDEVVCTILVGPQKCELLSDVNCFNSEEKSYQGTPNNTTGLTRDGGTNQEPNNDKCENALNETIIKREIGEVEAPVAAASGSEFEEIEIKEEKLFRETIFIKQESTEPSVKVLQDKVHNESEATNSKNGKKKKTKSKLNGISKANPFACLYCKLSFTLDGKLKKHIWRKHSEKYEDFVGFKAKEVKDSPVSYAITESQENKPVT